MSVAIGAAIGKKLNNDKNIVYSLHGDGELDEGQNWEGIMFAGAKNVDNLISAVDWNGQQIDGPLVAFSEAMRANDRALRAFLTEHMYRHYRVSRMGAKAKRIVRELYDLLSAAPDCLPTEWRLQAEGAGTAATARVVADYIAGMTDRFALDEHYRLFDRYATT